MTDILKPFLVLGACITAFFISLQLINTLPDMFTSTQSMILSSTVTFIILIIMVRTVLKGR